MLSVFRQLASLKGVKPALQEVPGRKEALPTSTPVLSGSQRRPK